jgi:hypothetical protein
MTYEQFSFPAVPRIAGNVRFNSPWHKILFFSTMARKKERNMRLGDLYPFNYLAGSAVGSIAATIAAAATAPYFGFDRKAATVAVATSCLFSTLQEGAILHWILPAAQNKCTELAPTRFKTKQDRVDFGATTSMGLVKPLFAISMLLAAKVAQGAAAFARREIAPLSVAQCALLGGVCQHIFKYPLESAIQALLQTPTQTPVQILGNHEESGSDSDN